MNSAQMFAGIFVMAIVTYIIRMIPMAFFSKPVRSVFFQSFLYYVPYAVLSAMTFPAIFSSDLRLSACLAGVIAALVSAWYGRSLLFVAAAAAFFAWIVQVCPGL